LLGQRRVPTDDAGGLVWCTGAWREEVVQSAHCLVLHRDNSGRLQRRL